MFPGNTICGRMLEFCKYPSPLPKKYCNSKHLKLIEPVVYDDATGVCSLAKLEAKLFSLVLAVDKDPEATRLILDCDGVAPKNMASLKLQALYLSGLKKEEWKCSGNAVKKNIEFDDKVFKLETQCNATPEDRFDDIEKQFEKACNRIGERQDQKPEFFS
ncbi:uncharacterized protein RCC_07523 [Ramularia collo-cygni]|uniref:Uncharacterized protein n=1 Tax=Ramularia collo-cygni TaxID=112498 RepID=A0A2D3V1H7_9PEZI|nr:uncharacterized protein RCC_07523 [Ramularia collo-cygni]CZT21658.1 uncharacterized protein RCC_07523 [Ramularia collo-cygni]